ncbi:hypothetical protein [Granulicella sp. L46]|uniref:hypothetical protein n=1 Tax=Granulicella sp. L46 TaxID=1641865 RepID=UPI00131A73B4|nr:hypothetical protein [Granulicella sp. L46]
MTVGELMKRFEGSDPKAYVFVIDETDGKQRYLNIDNIAPGVGKPSTSLAAWPGFENNGTDKWMFLTARAMDR